jgi:hypothetical protein
MLHSVKCHLNQDKLTKSSLLDQIGYECEGRKKFYYYFHENVCQGGRRRDPNINTKSAEEVLEGRKHKNKCVVAGTNIFDCLRDFRLDVTRICTLESEKGTYSK